jgi:hypothetical protein
VSRPILRRFGGDGADITVKLGELAQPASTSGPKGASDAQIGKIPKRITNQFSSTRASSKDIVQAQVRQIERRAALQAAAGGGDPRDSSSKARVKSSLLLIVIAGGRPPGHEIVVPALC